MKQVGGGYIVLPNSVFVSIDTSARKLGVVLPRIILPDDAERNAVDKVEVLFQPNPREQRTVRGEAKLVESKNELGQNCVVIKVKSSYAKKIAHFNYKLIEMFQAWSF